jgi:hypothetical protein
MVSILEKNNMNDHYDTPSYTTIRIEQFACESGNHNLLKYIIDKYGCTSYQQFGRLYYIAYKHNYTDIIDYLDTCCRDKSFDLLYQDILHGIIAFGNTESFKQAYDDYDVPNNNYIDITMFNEGLGFSCNFDIINKIDEESDNQRIWYGGESVLCYACRYDHHDKVDMFELGGWTCELLDAIDFSEMLFKNVIKSGNLYLVKKMCKRYLCHTIRYIDLPRYIIKSKTKGFYDVQKWLENLLLNENIIYNDEVIDIVDKNMFDMNHDEALYIW